ncbi:hypothetical protein Bca101_025161 [Brassica carinata]
MWAASCLASCCAACACDACRTVVSSISRRSVRIAYCSLFALSLIVSWILREVAAPLMEKLPWINHFHKTPDREWFETDDVLRVSLGNFQGEEERVRPTMDSSRRRTSGALDNSAATRAPMMSRTSLFGQSAGSSRRLTSEEVQRCRNGDGIRNSAIVSTSEGKRSSSTRKHYGSAMKGIETLQVSDERFHRH